MRMTCATFSSLRKRCISKLFKGGAKALHLESRIDTPRHGCGEEFLVRSGPEVGRKERG